MKPRPRRFGKKVIATCIVLTVLVALFFSGIPSQWCRDKASSELLRHNWSGTRTWLDRARLFDSDHPENDFIALRLARYLGRPDEIESAFESLQAANYSPKKLKLEIWLLEAQSGNLENLEPKLAELLIAGDDLPPICEAYAMGCIQNYRIDDALQIIDLWQADFPADPNPHFLRGRVLEHRSNFGEAEDEYRLALDRFPQHAASAYNLGRLLLLKQEAQQAAEYFRICMQSPTGAIPGMIGLASAHRELGEFEQAQKLLEQAERQPTERLAESYRLVGETSEAAAGKLDEARGLLAQAQDDFAAAAKYFSAALEKSPYQWRLRFHLGNALRQLGKVDEAERELKRFNEASAALQTCDRWIDLLKSDPDNAEARYNVGSVMLQHVSPNQGLLWLSSVLESNPEHLPTHQCLAEYYRAHETDAPQYSALADRHEQIARKLQRERSQDSARQPGETE